MSRSFAGARSCFPSHWTPTFPAGEPPRRRCAGELLPRRRPTPSVCFQGQHLTASSHRGPWMRPMDTFLSTSQPLPGSSRAALRALCLAATPGQAPHAPYAPCGRRRGPSTRCVMGRAPLQLGRAGSAHYACAPIAQVSARGRCFK
jgi:hypothetical protein